MAFVLASIPLRTAIYTALTTGAGATALAALGVSIPAGVRTRPGQGQDLPYVLLVSGTEVEGERSDATRSTEPTRTVKVYAAKEGAAEAIAGAVVTVLAEPLTLSGAPYIVNATLDYKGDALIEPDTPTAYGLVLRFRYTAYQAAA